MNAAIYVRRSKEQPGRAEEQKSVARQEENARKFAASKGWIVADDHVFVDDGISGAEFDKRPGLQRLLTTALRRGARSPFVVVVVEEQKAIGREAVETNYTIKQLDQAGVKVIECLQGRILTPQNALDKMTSSVMSVSDELHREQSRVRVHLALTRNAERGYVTGGRVYGYRNQDVYVGTDLHGRGLKSHVVRVVDPTEAAVVRRIFEWYSQGDGLKAIATRLTTAGVMPPRGPQRHDGLIAPGWMPSTIRAMLARDLYRGDVVWNRSRKRDNWGQKNQQPRPASEHITVHVPDLEMIDAALWTRVQARRRDVESHTLRMSSGRLSGRPPVHGVRNLLAGYAKCGVCGSTLVGETSGRKGSPLRHTQYACHRRRRNGGCSNALRVPANVMHEAVLQAIEEHALTPEAVEHVVCLNERDETRERHETLTHERADVERKIARLVDALATLGDVQSVGAKLRELEARRHTIDAELKATRPLPRLPHTTVLDHLAQWRGLLRQSPTQAQGVLRKVLAGPIVFTPRADGQGYDFAAPTRFDKLFAGVVLRVPPLPDWIDVGRTDGLDAIRDEDTIDYDYGQLLARVAGDGICMASPVGFEPTLPA